MRSDEFAPDASHLVGKPGWLLALPVSEWADALRDEYDDRDFAHIVRAHQKQTLAPGIRINGDFADGSGRSKFYHAIGSKMPVADFETARPRRNPGKPRIRIGTHRTVRGELVAELLQVAMDDGWRVPIKVYSALTDLATRRSSMFVAFAPYRHGGELVAMNTNLATSADKSFSPDDRRLLRRAGMKSLPPWFAIMLQRR